MYSPNTIVKLNAIAYKYKDLIRRAITEVLEKYRNTGAGVASVVVEVTDGTADTAPIIEVKFDEHLVVLNKRKVQWTKLPNMKKLIEWAETKESDPKKAKRLAFSTAWDKLKHDTWKARPWRKKALSDVLKEMNELVLKEFDAAIEQDFQLATQV